LIRPLHAADDGNLPDRGQQWGDLRQDWGGGGKRRRHNKQ
jgi:hypothetical protein